jgi:hypothetical protein
MPVICDRAEKAEARVEELEKAIKMFFYSDNEDRVDELDLLEQLVMVKQSDRTD